MSLNAEYENMYDEANDSRGDNLVAVDKLGIWHGFTMTFEHMQWLLGVSQVVVVDTVICHRQTVTNYTTTTTTTTTITTT